MAEAVADEAHVALGAEGTALAVEGDDAAGLLSAMLQGVEAEGGEDGGVVAPEDAEHAALVAHAVFFAGMEIVVFQSGVEERVWTGQGRLRVGRYWVVWALAGGASTEPVKISITPDRPPPTRPAALSRYG